jgi:hypothetical protein
MNHQSLRGNALTHQNNMTIPSQLSKKDCKILQAVQTLVAAQQSYTYLEIGSYLGGSLHAHLSTPRCDAVWSVDRRATGLIQDERNINYAYSATTQDMLDLLSINNISTTRLYTIDGTVADVPSIQADIVFIDGEHTNSAALSDAVNSLRFDPQVILFHDDWIVSWGIDNFIQYLVDGNIPADVYKFRESDITAVVFGQIKPRFADFARSRTQNWLEFRTQATERLNREKK